MANDVPFRELVQYAVGGGWGDEKPSEESLAVRVIRGTDFGNIASGAFDQVPRRFEARKKAERRLLQANDIVLEISGGSRTSNQSTGRTLFITQDTLDRLAGPVIPASFCRLVRLRDDVVSPRYAYYALQEMYRSGRAGQYEHHSTGISNFQFEYFLDQELVRLPPLPEQRAIASILTALDGKIELNRKMNETLEAMARALFKSWFVDFDPVRAKAEGRDPGLPPHLADLFPDSFEESELGEIPAGWRAGTLADIGRLNPESWTARTRPGHLDYVDLSNTKWGRIESTQRFETEKAPSRAQRVLRPGDTIVGTVRPGNGSYALVSDDGLTGSTGFAVLRPSPENSREALYLAATDPRNIERLAHLADGAAYPAVRPEVVAASPVNVPPGALLSSFSELTGPLLDKIAAAERQSRTLAGLRDSLLPKLISGDLRLPDPDSFLERTVST